jgi:hypothetical protein
MKTVPLLLAVLLAATLHAQAQDEDTHAPDGGTMFRIQSITIPPLGDAPFTATVNTQLARALADGNVQIMHNSRTVARDSAGRVYQERALFVHEQEQEPPQPREIDISDPLTHRLLICYPASRQCTVSAYYVFVSPQLLPAGPLPGNRGYLDRISLGKNSMSGLDVTGTRETTTYYAGVFGNQKPLTVVKEFWYSPQLDVNLSVHRSDPRFGVQDFTVTNINLSEPEPSLFLMPRGYRLADAAENSPVAAPPPELHSR